VIFPLKFILKVKKIRNLIFSLEIFLNLENWLIYWQSDTIECQTDYFELSLSSSWEKIFIYSSYDSLDMRWFSKNPLIACFFFCGTLARRWFNKFPQCSRSNDANKQQAAKNYYFSWKQHLIFIQIAKSFLLFREIFFEKKERFFSFVSALWRRRINFLEYRDIGKKFKGIRKINCNFYPFSWAIN
jgi:hypothetical protein